MVPFYDWSLSAIVLTGLIYPTWRVAKLGKRALHDNPPYTDKPPQADQLSPGLIGKQIRGLRLRWISIGEFTSLLARFGDLILIDLRQTDEWGPLPVQVPTAAFCVRHHELAEMLEHLPGNRILVVNGLTDLDAIIIEASSRAKGPAPIYILDNYAPYTEAA